MIAKTLHLSTAEGALRIVPSAQILSIEVNSKALFLNTPNEIYMIPSPAPRLVLREVIGGVSAFENVVIAKKPPSLKGTIAPDRNTIPWGYIELETATQASN